MEDPFPHDKYGISGNNSSNYLDMSSRSFNDSTSNDNINVTINLLNESGQPVGNLSGSMHLSDLNISHPSLLNISGNTTRPDESFTLGDDHSYSFNFSNNSLTGNLTTSMHLSDLELSLNSTANTDRESSSFVGTSFGGPSFGDPSSGGKRRRKKRTLKKKRSRKNKKRSRSRR